MSGTDGPRFSPPSGPVTGWRDGPVTRATGIPYATAERFAVPRPVEDRTEEFLAQRWSPLAPQPVDPIADDVFGVDPRPLRTDEHCQYLSVTVPAAPSSASMPVMVWIHGGGFVTGGGDQSAMDPAALVAEQEVVVVTVGYRLGLLGFVQTEHGGRANLGLLDQIEAFRWVRRNIAAFGGDPDDVTAFGQSAGAAAIADLMATEDPASLFRRAILQSAPFGITRRRAAMDRELAPHAAVVGADTPLTEVAEAQAAYLRSAAPFGFRGGMPIAPQYGYAPLPDEQGLEAALDRSARAVDVLVGHTTEEARLFLPSLTGLHPWMRLPVVGRLIERAVVSYATRAVYGHGARVFARRHRRAGGRAGEYVLSWSAPGNPLGAAHTVDLPLLFGDETTWRDAGLVAGSAWSATDRDGRLLREVWGRFAKGEQPVAHGQLRRFLRLHW